MRIFQTVKKVIVGGGGGGTPAVRSLGQAAVSLAVSAVLGAQSLGQAAVSGLGALLVNLTVATGVATASMTASNVSGSGSRTAGTATTSLSIAAIDGAVSRSLGTAAPSLSASASGLTVGYTTLATSFGSWTNPANAQGVQNATSATITGTSGSNVSGTLSGVSFAGSGAPSGYTRAKVELVVRQQIDTTVGALSTASCELHVKKSDGTGDVVVLSSTASTNTRNNSGLVTDTLDITTEVAAWTNAEVLGMRWDAVAAANLLAVTGGNFTWSVDALYLQITWTKTGIT